MILDQSKASLACLRKPQSLDHGGGSGSGRSVNQYM